MAGVAALYVQSRGPYPRLLGPLQCWDEERDARSYGGPWPVVAHPPCAHWGRLKGQAKQPTRDLAPLAVEQVERWGGVLEHPADSSLWSYCGLPAPGVAGMRGRTVACEQWDWGHEARKRTWLYICGFGGVIEYPAQRAGEPSVWVDDMCRQKRERTPEAFARWLIELASRCSAP